MRLVLVTVLLCITHRIQACKIPLKKKPKVILTGDRWNLPPDNEDWWGFVNLLGTRDETTTKWFVITTKSEAEQDPNFPWPGAGPSQSVFSPPNESKIKKYVGQSPSCFLFPDEGEGNDDFVRWYYNFQEDRCEEFTYFGKGGNTNRFISRGTCHENCQKPPVPCCVPDYLINYESFILRPDLKLSTS